MKRIHSSTVAACNPTLIRRTSQEKQSGSVVATSHPLGDLSDNHPLLPEPKDLLLLSRVEAARSGAGTMLSKQA